MEALTASILDEVIFPAGFLAQGTDRPARHYLVLKQHRDTSSIPHSRGAIRRLRSYLKARKRRAPLTQSEIDVRDVQELEMDYEVYIPNKPNNYGDATEAKRDQRAVAGAKPISYAVPPAGATAKQSSAPTPKAAKGQVRGGNVKEVNLFNPALPLGYAPPSRPGVSATMEPKRKVREDDDLTL
ncbi:MAG TPA: hypothetical protein VFR09_07525 [Alphaproteobacteria bacterium]|nr:hypothetical protein [Alphaproteobacteria bacterium]